IALALATLAEHFGVVEWQGLPHAVVHFWITQLWDPFVRPAVRLLSDATVTAAINWALGSHSTSSDATADYFAVGLMLAGSLIRWALHVGSTGRSFVFAFLTAIAWPVAAPLAVWLGLGLERGVVKNAFLTIWLSPLAYFLTLLLFNLVLWRYRS